MVDALYDNLKEDGWVENSREHFRDFFLAPGEQGYKNRLALYENMKEDGYVESPTYEEFMRRMGATAASKAQAPRDAAPSAPAAAAPKPATRYFKLRRGGEDFTVTTDEVNAAGGLGAWAEAHPGAPVRVYMQGKNEDGTDFNGHVDLSVAHDRNKRLGYKYSTYSQPIVNKPQKSWTPTTQQKIAMSHQLHQMQKQADDMLEQSRERTQNVSEYYRNNRGVGFHAVEDKPTYNPDSGKVEKTYLTPTGDRTTDKNLADMEAQEARAQYEFNNRMKAAGLHPSNDMDVNRQMITDRLKEIEARLKVVYAAEDEEKYGDRPGESAWDQFLRISGANTRAALSYRTPQQEQNLTIREKEIKNLLAEYDILTNAKRRLDAGRDLKQSEGFMGGLFDIKNNAKNMWRSAFDKAGDVDFWLRGTLSAHDAERLDKIKAKVESGDELTDSELSLAYAQMLNEGVSATVKLPHGYTIGGIETEMIPFMLEMALNPASGLGRALTKKFGTTALKRIAASVAGDVAEAAVLSNSLQAPRTIADIRNRHRGEITEHDGKIGFVGGESLPMAIYKGEASSIIENYTELLGSHFGAIGKGIWRGVDKGARKLGAGKVMDNVSRMVNNIKASDWVKGIANIESRAQWNGTIGEVMEEEAGIVLNSIFTGDNKLSDLVDAEQQIDIVLGVGLFGGFVSGIKTAGYPIARAHANSNLRKKDSEGVQLFSSDKWAAIKEQIDTSEDEALAQTVLSMVKLNGHSQEQQRAIIEYAAALTKARGYNLADASRKQEPQTETDSVQDEVDTAFNEGYEAATPQEMADAQNMFEYQRQRAEDILADQQLLDILDSNPVGALMGMTQTGMYTQEEIDAARDYANAKTVRDGILQRVTDDIEEKIAQSDAMINGRVNRETGSILSATMDLDDRQVYIVGGEVVMNPDGTIDYDASDESLVVRDAVTGELEFTAPKSIVKVGEAIDPEAEKANAADNIRQQAAQAAANALNGTLAFNPGDVVRINDGGGLTDVTIVGPVVDEESGMPVESQLTVQFPNGQQTAFTKEQLQAFADAANLERLNQYEQERAAQRAQQRGAAEVEAMRPTFALNDEFTILNDDGTPIHGSITGELDEDGMVEIYTEEPVNGNKVNRFMPGELEGMFDAYNGAAIATAAPEDSEGGESSAEAAVQNHPSEAEAEQPETALGRIPLGENGKPDFGAVDAETAWYGLVEKYEGNKGRAQGFAANMVKIKEAALKKAEKVKSKPTEDPDEWDAAEQERENAIEQARRELEHWQSVAGVDEKRQAAVRAQQEAERAEAERAEREVAEAEKKRKAALDKRLRDTFEDVKDVPEAVEVLEDMDPRDIYEAAAQLLSGQKVLWGDAGVKVGARSETGFGEEERRRLFGLFASETNGGKSLSRLTEDAMKQQCETYGIPYDNQDARNALIDVISGARTVGDIRNYIANNRIDEARRLAEAKRRHEEEQYDEFCRQEYHLSAEEVEAYEDQLLAELSERDREFDANEYNDYIADEMARAAEITEQQKNGTEDNDTRRGSTPGDRRVQENDTEGKGTVPGRGYEVLPESRADQSSGAAADGDRSGIQPADGVQGDGPASAVAQGAQRGGIAAVGRRKADDSPYGGLVEEVTSAIGPFGKIYTQFRGKPREAVTFLLAKRDGEAIGALHHKDVGEIDLVWGEEGSAHSDGFGLAKLAKYHPEVLFNLQEILNDMAVTKRSANRVQLESEKYKAAVRLTWDNQKKTWLLTMFEKKNSVLDNTTDTDKTHKGNGNDTATPENTVVSDRKDNDFASDKQASGEESLPQLSDDKRKPGLQAAVEAASAEVNTEPTEAQKKAGNYKKGHVTIGSFDITIENPAGSVRRGVDADGKEWSTTMANAYGEIRGTQSVDGDPIDVFLATDMDAWNGRKVFVVDQTNTDGSFDEHKVMLGFNDKDEAMGAYLANYDKTWADTHPGLRITEASLDDFQKWVESSHRKTKAFADYSMVKGTAEAVARRQKDEAGLRTERPERGANYYRLKSDLVGFAKKFKDAGTANIPAIEREMSEWMSKQTADDIVDLDARMLSDVCNEAGLDKGKAWAFRMSVDHATPKGLIEEVFKIRNDRRAQIAPRGIADVDGFDMLSPESQAVVEHYLSEHGSKAIRVITGMDDIRALGFPKEVSEAFEEVVAEGGIPALYNSFDKKIYIFADVFNSARRDDGHLFHENVHGAIDECGSYPGEFLSSFRRKVVSSGYKPELFRSLESMLKDEYDKDSVDEEFLAYTLQWMLNNKEREPRIMELLGDEEKEFIYNNILNKIRYAQRRRTRESSTEEGKGHETLHAARQRAGGGDGVWISRQAAVGDEQRGNQGVAGEPADGEQSEGRGSLDSEVYEAAKGLLEAAGVDVVEVSDTEAAEMLNRRGSDVPLMGSRTDRKMAKIADHFEGRELDENQQAVVDVFSGKRDNVAIEVESPDGKRRVVMRQGREPKAGAKHSLFRHYDTHSNYITTDDIAMIPDVIARGERIVDGKRIAYDYELEDGVRLKVTTQITDRREEFTNLFSDRKNPQSELVENTQLSARASDVGFSDAKIGENSETGKPQLLRTSEGVVYGWTVGGKVYLNRDAMNPKTPLHEYTHLWDEMVRRENPELWARGKELMKQTPMWQEVIEDPNYGDIRDDEDAVASEVHSRLTGKDGARILSDMIEDAKKDGPLAVAERVTLVERLKRWLGEMFSSLKKTLSQWSKRDLESLTLEDFTRMTLRDLAEGINPKREMQRGDQMRMVTKENPMLDDYHTGIRTREDVKTFDEMLSDAEANFREYGSLSYPDMDIEMLREAKRTGEITVYSSKPIRAGHFVTPSRMNAEDYAGGEKVYSKKVSVEDIAWISEDEGQFAPVHEVANDEGLRFHAAMSRGREEFDALRERAISERGVVMPGLNEAEVRVVEVPRHDFTGTGKEALQAAEKWAKEKIVGMHAATDSRGDEFEYSISNDAVEKYVSRSATDKSKNIGVHLAALKKLPEIISESIEAEVHPDYNKQNGERNVGNGYNPSKLVHRFYGAINIDGTLHRVKTTIEEYVNKSFPNAAHSYEVTEIEAFIEETMNAPTDGALTSTSSREGILGVAKLMQGVEKSYDPGKKLLDESAKGEIRYRQGDGYGAYSDAEVSFMNDPVSKVVGKNRFSKKRQAEFAARERQRMADRIQRLAERMHLDNVEVVTDVSQLEGKRAKAKGFYNKRTGKITIVLPNNYSTIDTEQTLLHEAVAHYGLRQLFGKQFDTFLDNVYQSADEGIRKKIAEMAAQNGWNFRTATEEYLAGLAEDTNFEDARGYASGWWQRVKRLFIDMLERIGFEGFRDKVGVVLTDNELRYILWRSYENLAEPGRYRSILGEAKDVAMQSDLKVGNYAERGIEAEYAAEPSAITELSKRFDEALKQYEERRLPQGFRFELGMPSAYLKSAGFPNLPICMRATLLARKAGDERHPFEASDLKGLVEAIQQPIAIFEYSKPNMRNLIVDVKRGDKHFLVGVTLDYKAGDIEINGKATCDCPPAAKCD